DLFPGSEVEFAVGDGHDNLAAHDLPFQMRIGVVFTGAVMLVDAGRLVGGQFFQPHVIIVVKPVLIVVNKNGRGDVHGVDQAKPFGNTATTNEFLNLGCDVDEAAAAGNFKPEMFGKMFQLVRN